MASSLPSYDLEFSVNQFALRFVAVAFVSVGVTAPVATAQNEEWSLRDVVQTYEASIFLYRVDQGTNDDGEAIWTKGTAFAISVDPPRLATVAHTLVHANQGENVTVYENVTGTAYTVQAIYRHSDFDPDQGGRNPYSPDIAILELAEPLPATTTPLPVSSCDDSTELLGATIAALSFSLHAMIDERQGESAEAILRSGHVRRVVDFTGHSTNTPRHERPLLELEMMVPFGAGESGSPIIDLTNGTVIGVESGTRSYNHKTVAIPAIIISFAMHARFLRELLADIE